MLYTALFPVCLGKFLDAHLTQNLILYNKVLTHVKIHNNSSFSSYWIVIKCQYHTKYRYLGPEKYQNESLSVKFDFEHFFTRIKF